MWAIYTCAPRYCVRACVRLHLYHGQPQRRLKVFARFIEKTSPLCGDSTRRRRRQNIFTVGTRRDEKIINNIRKTRGRTERSENKNHYAKPTAAAAAPPGTRDRIPMYFYDERIGENSRPAAAPVPISRLRPAAFFPLTCATCVVIFVSPRPRPYDSSVPRETRARVPLADITFVRVPRRTDLCRLSTRPGRKSLCIRHSLGRVRGISRWNGRKTARVYGRTLSERCEHSTARDVCIPRVRMYPRHSVHDVTPVSDTYSEDVRITRQNVNPKITLDTS